MDREEGTVEVTCGAVSALLHRKEFICPGIRQLCIEVDGKFVTPKDFSYIGGKHTLKDWKTAIKIQGISLRKLMDTGELDFYDHTDQCTGKCVSRTLGSLRLNASSLTTMTSPSADMASLDDSTSSLTEPSYSVLHQVNADGSSVSPTLNINFADYSFLTEDAMTSSSKKRGRPRKANMAAAHAVLQGSGPETILIKQEPESFDSSIENSTSGASNTQLLSSQDSFAYVITPNSISHQKKIMSKNNFSVVGASDMNKLADSFPDVEDLLEDSQRFWQSIVKLGIMDSVMKEIKQALDQMKHKLVVGNVQEQDANRLSRAISELGLTKTLKIRLAEQKTAVSRQDIKLQIEIDDLKRKLVDNERKQEENKAKSEAFNSLIEMGKQKANNKQDTASENTTKRIKLANDMDYDPERDSDDGSE